MLLLLLLHQDHCLKGGDRFWTGAKRFPRSAELDMLSAEQHAAFVLSTANLLAAGYGVSPHEGGMLPLDHPQRDVAGVGLCFTCV